MVTNNEEQTTTAEPQAEVQVEDITQEPVAETTEQPVAETVATPTEQPQAKEPVAETATETPPAPQPTGQTPEQVLAQREQELQYYRQQEAENQLRQKAGTYQTDLINQGYSSEEANKAANNYYEQQKQVEQQKSFNEMQRLESIGKQKATIFYAKKYNLGIDDLLQLENSMNPGQMEFIAKRISEERKLRQELDTLKRGQVPTQQFDTNQPAASASGSEDELMDQYIAGVRNPQTNAAAARAAGRG